MSKLPSHYEKFLDAFPRVGDAYQTLGVACLDAGPLDRKTATLVKLALAIGAGLEGASHAHVRKALKAGASGDHDPRLSVHDARAGVGAGRARIGLAGRGGSVVGLASGSVRMRARSDDEAMLATSRKSCTASRP